MENNNNKLSVLQRSSNETGWHESTQFTPDQINKIQIFASKSDKSLNAIPSPLARIHLFDSAFRLVHQDETQTENNSGEVYRKIVSDCFDVFELIYNWNFHIREGKNLEIVSWKNSTEILKLGKIFNEEKEKLKKNKVDDILTKDIIGYKHNLLAKTVALFLKQRAFENFNEIQIIKLDGIAIAGTSPFTGYFTTPNDLSKLKLANPTNDKKPYFSNTRLFNVRSEEIKKFIYSFFTETGSSVFDSKLAIRVYLEHHVSSVSHNLKLNLEPLKANEKKILNTISLQSSKGEGVSDLFEPVLIKVNYRLNDECFYIPNNNNPERKYDYLLPFKEAFFNKIDNINEIPSVVSIEEMVFKNTRGEDEYTVDVKIKKDGVELVKRYQTNLVENELGVEGKIFDLYETHSMQFNLAIFPFIKVTNEEANFTFNDYYRLMLVSEDKNFLNGNDDFKLTFGKDKKLVLPGGGDLYKVDKEHRTISGRDIAYAGSTYFSLNFCFDFIQLELPKLGDSVKCMIVPKWKEKPLRSKQMDFAVDFGTTTTFVAFVDPANNKKPKPLSFAQDQRPVALLNKPKKKESNISWTACFEYYSLIDFDLFFEVQRQEFIPSIIDNEEYGFPFRTAVYESKAIHAKKLALINSNISFSYQKRIDRATELFNHYLTNLKWNVKTDDKYKESIEVFVEELLHLLRLKALLNECDPRKSNISWFSPLSFTPGAQFEYDQIWKIKYKEIFKGEATSHLKNITESEAPFYYYTKGDVSDVVKIEEPSSVLTLDIGGGTTDIMYFRGDTPVIGTSVHFGANVLWGDGYSDFTDSKNNGIYNSLKGTIVDRLKPTLLKELHERLINPDSEFGSDEIINFWILNHEKSGVLRELNKGDFKFSYLLHLSALIYHSCKLLKHHSHTNPAPKCFIFTGNGSRYLDLIQTKPYIEKICGYFIRKIFSSDAKNPQIILPDTNRKEATCFGGLYQPFNSGRQFTEVNYLGFENPTESFKKYKNIDISKEVVFDRLITSFEEFINCFFEMNDDTELTFRKHFAIEANLTALKNFISTKARANLEAGYTMRKKSASLEDDITDSLFFYPLVELLYRINKLSKDNLSEFIPRTLIYAPTPDGENSFDVTRLTTDKKADSIFFITIDDSHPDFGEISIIGDAAIYKRALTGINSFLQSTCEFKEFPDTTHQSINVITPGRVEKVNNAWVIKQKIQIEFVS